MAIREEIKLKSTHFYKINTKNFLFVRCDKTAVGAYLFPVLLLSQETVPKTKSKLEKGTFVLLHKLRKFTNYILKIYRSNASFFLYMKLLGTL